MHKFFRYVYGTIFFLNSTALGSTGSGGSLMVGAGSQIINNITHVTSGYDPSMNFGNGTPTGVPVGGGMPVLPGSNMPMMPPGAGGGGAPVPWNQSGMIVPPLQQMMSSGVTPGMMPGSMPSGMMPSGFASGMMPGMMAPGQAASMGVTAQLGANASMMTALSGQAGTLGAAAMGLPMNTGLGSSGMMPGMSPFGGASLPGMPQNPSMMGMMMGMGSGMGLGGFAGMGMQSAMMMFSPQYQQQYNQMQASTSSKTFRIVSSLTNQTLTSKSNSQLKKYQDDLETLVSLPEESLPSGVSAEDIDMQLSRINIALTDKGTLMADPDGTTVPENGLREERNERLNALLVKWSTPDGKSSTTGSRFQSRAVPSRVGGSGAMALVRAKQMIEKIEADERQLTVAKTELSSKQDNEMIRRIDNALYNTLLAKAKEYDELMDKVGKKNWEQIIDQDRGLSTSSLQLRGNVGRSSGVHVLSGPTRSSVGMNANRFGRDEALELHREVQALLKALDDRSDMAIGGDAGVKAQLQVHLQTLDQVVDALNDPSLPNPFRSASPEMQQVLQIWTQVSSISFDDLQKMNENELEKQVKIFQSVVSNPKPRLHPQMKYSDAQDVFNRLVSVLASKEYEDTNEKQSVATSRGGGVSGMIRRATTGGTRAKAMYKEGEDLVAYLIKGYFGRSNLETLSNAVTWDDAVRLVKSINIRTAQSGVWDSKSDRDERVKGAQAIISDLLEKSSGGLDTITASDLKRTASSRLGSAWSVLSSYYYNADYATWEDTLPPKEEEDSARASTKNAPAQSGRSRFGRLFGGR
jgi:hypothetical protein